MIAISYFVYFSFYSKVLLKERNVMIDFKVANELHWIVKGHLIPDEWSNDKEQVKAVYDSYLKRIWGNHEASIHLEGFEEAWREKYGD